VLFSKSTFFYELIIN